VNDSLTIFEYESVYDSAVGMGSANDIGQHGVSSQLYFWLKKQCLGLEEREEEAIHWLKLRNKGGREIIQFAGYVGVLRAPNGEQIEILPKTGLAASSRSEAIQNNRRLLINMLRTMHDFRHFKSSEAELESTKLPLLEIFIRQFLLSVESIVRRGLRSDYLALQDNLFALRGKLLISQHIKYNTVRRDRFFTEHDEYSPNRPENRLVASALRNVLKYSRSAENQKLARELSFVFNDIPDSPNVESDFQKIRLDRGMGYYEAALDWASLVLTGKSPLTGSGKNAAISLLFPMAAVFEAYVARSLARTLPKNWQLKEQSSKYYLVKHRQQNWFQLKPDILIMSANRAHFVLDTKWKLLDEAKSTSKDKYGLSQADFYQLYAYGQFYLEGAGRLVLIYPKTEQFKEPLEEFVFGGQDSTLKLSVVPYDLENNRLVSNILDGI
jgi:5-methylcytosine-specific restriction enzyme subunit McrC